MIENVTAKRYLDCAGAVLYWCGFTIKEIGFSVAAQVSWAFNKPTVVLYLPEGFENFPKKISVNEKFNYGELLKELRKKVTDTIVSKYYPDFVGWEDNDNVNKNIK